MHTNHRVYLSDMMYTNHRVYIKAVRHDAHKSLRQYLVIASISRRDPHMYLVQIAYMYNDVHWGNYVPWVLLGVIGSVVQCGAVWCSVVQCGVVCCSVLQCVSVCCSVMPCVVVCYCVLQWAAVGCGVLQCVAVCCSVCLYWVSLVVID